MQKGMMKEGKQVIKPFWPLDHGRGPLYHRNAACDPKNLAKVH